MKDIDVVLAALALIIVVALYCVPRQQKTTVPVGETSQAVVPEQAQPATSTKVRPVVVEQNDGSVIIHDKGASFKVAPLSNRQPAVVPEEMVRAAQKP